MIYEAIARGIWALLAQLKKGPVEEGPEWAEVCAQNRRFSAMHRRAQRAEGEAARLRRRVARFEAERAREIQRARECAECGGTGEQEGPDPNQPACVVCGGTGERDPLDDLFGASGECAPLGCR